MIKDTTVALVKDLPISDIVGQYITLKKKGKDHKACCPFHDEKTASFSVNDAKGIYKCFGCGEAGDGIAFVMKFQKLSFQEAVREIAEKNGIPVEYENLTEEEKSAREKEWEQRKAVQFALNYAASWYLAQDVPEIFMRSRKFSAKTLNKFGVGLAPSAKRDFSAAAAKAGYMSDILQNAGLTRLHQESKSVYDYFQDRIVFPIHDWRGQVIAFAGRLHESSSTQDAPKYINSPEGYLWVKSKHLYGLHLAIKEIESKGFCYLVEGYTDVWRFHEKGLNNVAGYMSSSVTEDQAKRMRKFTDTVVLVPDNDVEKGAANPGMQAMHRNAELLIKLGFTVKVLIPGTKNTKKNTDPDDYLKRKHTDDEVHKWLQNTEDYISDFMVKFCMEYAKGSPKEKADQVKKLNDLIDMIPDEVLKTAYYDAVSGDWPDFKKLTRAKASKSVVDKLNQEDRLLFFDHGFWEDEGAYYILDKNKKKTRVCDFTMEMLFFIYADDCPKYVMKLRNISGRQRMMVISTDDFSTVQSFKKMVNRVPGFHWEGDETSLVAVKRKLEYGLKESIEVADLGWNNYGQFYAWVNGIFFNKKFFRSNKYGVVGIQKPIKGLDEFKKLDPQSQVLIGDQIHIIDDMENFFQKISETEVSELINNNELFHLNYFFLPHSTRFRITTTELADVNNHLKFKHYEKPGVGFSAWSKKIVDVYGDNGKVMICYYIAALFRSIIYKANDNWFPILFNFGEPRSGKSKAAESLCRMFGDVIPDGINLEKGSTPTGITRYMSSITDAIIWLNEYKNTLSDVMIGMLKGLVDGSGKLTGDKTSGKETKNYLPASAAVVCGQDLPTRDPALFSRCLFNEFDKNGPRNEQAFQDLKNIERDGYCTAVTCEMLTYRDVISAYPDHIPGIRDELINYCSELEEKPDDRDIMNLYTILLPVRLLMKNTNLKLPFTYEDIRDIMICRMKEHMEIQATANDVEQYMIVLSSLVGQVGGIREGEHFKIVKETDGVKLFLRTRAVHPFYKREAPRQGVVPLLESVIKKYLEKHRFFLEYREKGVEFEHLNNSTSAMVLDFDLIRNAGIEFNTKHNILELVTADDSSRELVNGKLHLNGNVDELVLDFISRKVSEDWQGFTDLLDEFNADKSTHIDRKTFMDALGRINAAHKFEITKLDEKATAIRIKTPF